MEVNTEKGDVRARSGERQRPALSGKGIALSLGACVLGFLFSRLHIVFSARPMAIALVAFLPSEVYFALLGGVVGGFFAGDGFISAISLLITLFVRVIICTADKESKFFSEPLILRMSAGLLGGFVIAVYEWLISGISVATALYGAAMLLISPLSVFVFSGMTEFQPVDVILGRSALPPLSGKEIYGRISALFFYASTIIFLHTVCLSLADISVFGIDLAFVFASAVTILIGARHGSVAGAATGFAVTFGVGGVQTVSFALLGLLSGALISLGAPIAVTAGALAFCLWAGYSGGLSGVLSLAPELVIAIAVTTPILKYHSTPPTAKQADEPSEGKADTLSRVGTMALSYRSKYAENTERFIASVEAISSLLGMGDSEVPHPDGREYEVAVRSAINEFCAECEHSAGCLRREVCPAMSKVGEIALALSSGERVSATDINTEREFCERRAELAKRINERASALEYEKVTLWRASRIGEELSLISKMMTESRERDKADVTLNSEMSERARLALQSSGIANFSVRVFGERRMRIFLAVEDKNGRIISSPEVKGALTEALGASLCDIEYYRDGEVSMLECYIGERYSASFAYRIKAADGDVSGDSAVGIRTSDGAFYGVLADGMGRGAIAHGVSDYLISITKNLLSFGIGEATLVKFLSCIMSRRGEAHSTLDIFRLDLYTGEGAFIKCGAAPSYIKRGGTIYRIGSEGTPIGAGSEALGERIRAEVRVGDTVVMTSDGVVDTRSAQLKFIERMSGEVGDKLSVFAEELVAPSDEGGDDRSALVIKIEECSKFETQA